MNVLLSIICLFQPESETMEFPLNILVPFYALLALLSIAEGSLAPWVKISPALLYAAPHLGGRKEQTITTSPEHP